MGDTLIDFIKGIACVWFISFVIVIIYALLGGTVYEHDDRDEWD